MPKLELLESAALLHPSRRQEAFLRKDRWQGEELARKASFMGRGPPRCEGVQNTSRAPSLSLQTLRQEGLEVQTHTLHNFDVRQRARATCGGVLR